jgi:hypothetical protein
MSTAQLEAQTKIEVAKIAAEASIIVAGMRTPPELMADGPETGPQSPANAPQSADPNETEHSVQFAPEDVHAAVTAMRGQPLQPGAQQ